MYINNTDRITTRPSPKSIRVSSTGEQRERSFANELEELLEGDAVQYTLSDEGKEKNRGDSRKEASSETESETAGAEQRAAEQALAIAQEVAASTAGSPERPTAAPDAEAPATQLDIRA